MKKLLSLLLMLMLTLTAAWAEEAALPAFAWERDQEHHWQLDAFGGRINEGAHNISQEDFRCTVCGCEVMDWGDGWYALTDYDEYGNVLRYTSIDNGAVTYDSVHALTYNDEGVVLVDVEYIGGLRFMESIYTVDGDGMQMPVKSTAWNDDGTTSINEYDEHGNCVRAYILGAENELIFENVNEFALNDDGWYYQCKSTSRFNTGESFYSEYNQYGDETRSLNQDADGNVWADSVTEYEYKDHVKVWKKHYAFGRLDYEEHYNEEGAPVLMSEYLPEGGRIEYTYDENGDVCKEETFAADGSQVQ